MEACFSRLYSKKVVSVVVLAVCIGVNIFVQAQSTGQGQNPSLNGQSSSAQQPSTSAPQNDVQITQGPGMPVGEMSSPSTAMINSGDLLDVTVFGVPELTQRSRVDSNGQIYLPLLGYVKLSGITVGAAQQKLEKALIEGEFVRTPHVGIYVAESSQGVAIFGEVVKPGMYSPNSVHSLLDLVTAAGGFTPATGNGITISHRDGSEPTKVSWDSESAKIPALNVPVTQGDTVTVSKAPIVYVVGEVVSPSGFIYDYSRKLTVLQAIAMAHGTTKDASLNGARLVRKSATGVQDIQVQLKKILQSKAPDITLEPEDILFVPTSAGKQAARRTVDTILSVAGAAAIRGTY